MGKRGKQGHTNVLINSVDRWKDLPQCCRVDLIGGAHVTTCKPLPPLALHKDEWISIGRFMGWRLSGSTTTKKDPTP